MSPWTGVNSHCDLCYLEDLVSLVSTPNNLIFASHQTCLIHSIFSSPERHCPAPFLMDTRKGEQMWGSSHGATIKWTYDILSWVKTHNSINIMRSGHVCPNRGANKVIGGSRLFKTVNEDLYRKSESTNRNILWRGDQNFYTDTPSRRDIRI